jgi:hypothetical protein
LTYPCLSTTEALWPSMLWFSTRSWICLC